MKRTIGEYFGARAAEYETRAEKGLPRYREMLSELTRSLPTDAGDILELGCGTGALTALIAERYPEARLTVVDAAPEMVDATRERLNDATEVRFITSTFERLDLEPGRYDLIAASMSLHHVADKAPFYRRLREGLRAHGALVFADELEGAVAYVQELHREAWLEFTRRPGHLTDAEIEDVIEHETEFDHYETLPRQLELLSRAGFQSVDCTWRYLNYGIFVALA